MQKRSFQTVTVGMITIIMVLNVAEINSVRAAVGCAGFPANDACGTEDQPATYMCCPDNYITSIQCANMTGPCPEGWNQTCLDCG